MSTNPTPTQTVQTMYAAFGRGDVAGILAHLHPNVDWKLNVDPAAPGASSIAPMRPRRGPTEVGEFFKDVAAGLDFHAFKPQSFMANEHEVAARVQMDFTVRSTGRRTTVESMHHFVFDDKGKVTRFTEFLDSLGEAAAWGKVQAKN